MTKKSKANCNAGCGCKKKRKPVDPALLKKEIAKWKREQKKAAKTTEPQRDGSWTSQVPPPPMDRYECMDEWYYCSYYAGEIDRLDEEALRISNQLDQAEANFMTALDSFTDCMLGMPV